MIFTLTHEIVTVYSIGDVWTASLVYKQLWILGTRGSYLSLEETLHSVRDSPGRSGPLGQHNIAIRHS